MFDTWFDGKNLFPVLRCLPYLYSDSGAITGESPLSTSPFASLSLRYAISFFVPELVRNVKYWFLVFDRFFLTRIIAGLRKHLATPCCITISGISLIVSPSVPLKFPRTWGLNPDFAIKVIAVAARSEDLCSISDISCASGT